MSLAMQIQDIYRQYQSGNHLQAEMSIRQCLQQHPGNSDALRLGALTALSLQHVLTAHGRMMQAFKSCEITAEMANTLGNILKAAGEWSQGEAAYRLAIQLDVNYAPVRANLVDLLVQSGQAARALSELDEQLKHQDENDLMRLARANALMNLGYYDGAFDVIEHIISPSLKDRIADLKTRLLFHLGQYDEMKAMAASISPTSPYAAEAMFVAANAYAMKGDWATGQAIIDTACRAEEASPLIFVKATQLLTRGNRNVAAGDIMRQAETRFGHQADIVAELASRELKAGNVKLSYNWFKEALSLRPGDFTIMTKYAQAALVAGQYEKCQKLIQACLQQSPNNQFLLALTATLQRKRGENYKTLYDYDRFVRVYDLEPPDGYETMEIFNDALKVRLEAYHSFQNAPLNQSLRGGTQTDKDLYVIDDPVLQTFFKTLKGPIEDYMQNIGKDPHHPLTRRNTGQYRINGAWSVRLASQGHHVNHVHPMGWLSSSYYVDVPDVVERHGAHEGWVKFGEPGIDNLGLGAEKFVKPEAGRLVLFPSYMWHGTIPFSGDQTRLTLPFDVVPV